MPCQDAASLCPALLEKQKVQCGHPPYRAGPVTDECQNPHGCNAVTTDAVVRIGEIDGGDGVGATKGKEGGELEDDRRQRDLSRQQMQSAENAQLDFEKEEERDVGDS